MSRGMLTAARHSIALLALFVLAGTAPAFGAAPPVIVAEARLASFADRVEALGTLLANESITISSTLTETVRAIHFDDGDRVEAGQLLVELTSGEENALLQEARSSAAEARRQFERVRALHAQGQAAISLLDERERLWETAEARARSIEARLADRRLRAPFAGVLGLRNVSVGALVEPGDAITTLDDDSVMKLDFSVPSTLLGVLRPGLEVRGTTRAWPGREFSGRLSAVDSRIDPVTRAVRVRARLPNADGALRPGMLMEVELASSPRENISLPEEALVPTGNIQAVFVVDTADGNRVERREVRIGTRRPGEVEVVSGLRPGELVITHGTTRVQAGERVTIGAVYDGSVPLSALLQNLGQ